MGKIARFRGIEITLASDQSDAPKGQAKAVLRIKPWYMPIFMLHVLKQSNIPMYAWPVAYWKYYTRKRRRINGTLY